MLNNTIVQHGLGYVGLTGAIHLCQAGFKVIGYDPDKYTVDGINNGIPRVGEYLAYIDDDVKSLVDQGKLSATTDFDSIKNKSIHFLSVPTELAGEPYLDIVKDCIIKLSKSIPEGGLIVVESTLQPGTIDEILTKIHRVVGEDIFIAVAYRVDWFADKEKNLTNLPRYIGGVTTNCNIKASEIISKVCSDVRLTNYRAAEVGKAGQNALYFVQIMGAYKMAYEYPDLDSNEALKLISSHWRLPDLYLGFGTSGRCIAAGAKYIVAGSKNNTHSILEDAIEWDKRMRIIVADIAANKLHVGDKAVVLGMAYRPNFSDMGYSAGLDVAKALKKRGIETFINDLKVPNSQLSKATDLPFGSISKNIKAILLATGHNEYLSLPEDSNLWSPGQIVIDGPGVWEKYRDIFKSYGVNYLRIGEPNWLGSKIPVKRNFNREIFNDIDTPEKAYWLGYLYADGCVEVREGEGYILQLVSKDRDIIEKFCRFIGCGHVQLIPRWMNYVYQISSKDLVYSLARYGIIPNKTYVHEKVYIPQGDLENHFFRGLFDGDGSLFTGEYKNGRVIGLNVSGLNLQLLEDCKYFFGRGSIQKVTKKADGYKWVYMGKPNESLKLLNKIYGSCLDNENIRMDRKWNLYHNYKLGIFDRPKNIKVKYLNHKIIEAYGQYDSLEVDT